MRKVRDILRQKLKAGMSHRQVAESLRISAGEVGKVAKLAAEAGLDWETVESMSEEDLCRRLFGGDSSAPTRTLPDFAKVHEEYQRKGVTLALLHVEYLEANPGGFQYTQFCEYYRRWLKARCLTMRQVHKGGEKLFTDFSGKRPTILDPVTGRVEEVELFVAVMGASSRTFARACRTQKVADWIECHVKAFEFFGGVPQVVVPDQLKSAVVGPSRYEPVLQRNFEEMAAHYGTVVVPARPRKPKDKAVVEVGVQVAQRWILARMRKEQHCSLESLNRRIAELVEELDHRPMKKYGASRLERFEQLDKAALQPLPVERFQHAEWKKATVNIDYHFEFDHHYYSVPFTLRGEVVEVRATATTVEAYQRGNRIDAYARSHVHGGYTTRPEHMPKAHQEHLEWSPTRLIGWAAREAGPRTAEFVRAILESKPHPEQGYRSCLGVMRLTKRYGAARMEAATARALAVKALSFRHLDSILQHGLDKLPPPSAGTQQRLPLVHENVRGKEYYQ